jgi:hypothetical protein
MRRHRERHDVEKWNRELDAVVAQGPGQSIPWLRGAFHTHETQIADLLGEMDELRALYLARAGELLTAREAQLLRVCRVCRNSDQGPMTYDFGEEYAHTGCLSRPGLSLHSKEVIMSAPTPPQQPGRPATPPPQQPQQPAPAQPAQPAPQAPPPSAPTPAAPRQEREEGLLTLTSDPFAEEVR